MGMKSKIYSICKPHVHSKAPVELLVLEDVCFPDFTKKSDFQILYLADFFVFETTNPEEVFAMSGDKELFGTNYRFMCDEMQQKKVPNYFYKHKCNEAGSENLYSI